MSLILMDLDGVICDNQHRAHLVPPADQRHLNSAWVPYVSACGGDSVITAGMLMYEVLNKSRFVAIVTSRQVRFEGITRIWWKGVSTLPMPNILYRPNGMSVSPAEYKRWRLQQLRKDGYVIDFAIDDDPAVIAMYRSEGVPTFQTGTMCASLTGGDSARL